MKHLPTLLLAAAISTLSLSAAHAADDVLIVYDASGSMWGQVDGVNKIITARKVMADLVKSWPEETKLGLIAYGHRSAGSCNDIETMIKPQQLDRDAFIKTVNAITPKGKTPISASLQQAADVLQYRDHNATVVLISDGLESCHGDPCAVAADLKAKGVNFTAHVVGFDLDQKGNEALSCIAKNTGGLFVPASNADELQDALQQVQAQVTQKQTAPEPAPEPESAPEPPPAEPEYTVQIHAPEQATAGARFDVSWTEAINNRDWVQIVPVGTPEGKLTSYIRVNNALKGQLTAPGEPGLYEVRYVLSQDSKTLASAPVEVTAPQQTISGPDVVRAGTPVEISWATSINPRDMIVIAPAGSPDNKLDVRKRADQQLQTKLNAPKQPGLYEIRYVLSQNNMVLARHNLEIVAADAPLSAGVVLQAPAQAAPGQSITVSWTGSSDSADQRVALAALDQADFTWIDAKKINAAQALEFSMPQEPGNYEIRYLDVKQRSVLGRSIIKVQ